MKKILLLSAISAAALMACTKESDFSSRENEISILATNEGDPNEPETMTYFANNNAGTQLALSWNKNQRVRVFNADGSVQRDFTNTEAGSKATFSGSYPADKTPAYAVYPSTAVQEFDGTDFTITIPSTQASSNVNSVGNNSNVTIGEVSGTSGSYQLAMKNICGLVKFYAPNAGIESVELCSENSYLAGKGTANYNGGQPTFTLSSDPAEKSKSITFTGIKHGACYYIAVLPGTYDDLSLVVRYRENSSTHTTKGSQTFPSSGKFSLTIQRNQVVTLPVLPVADDVVELDFSNNANPLGLPTGSGAGKKDMTDYPVSCTIPGLNISVGVYNKSVNSSDYAYLRTGAPATDGLMLNGLYAGIKIPAVIGDKRLVMIEASEANNSGTGTRLVFFTRTEGATHENNSGWSVNGYARTSGARSSYYTIPDANNISTYPENVYLYGAYASSNVIIRKLTLYYSYGASVYGY